MEKKREVEKDKKAPDNEVRVTTQTFIRTYLAYIARLFQDKHDKVIIKGMGYAVPKAVSLAMLVRHRFKGLHQIVEVNTMELTDRDLVRKVGLISITLSKKELDKSHIGYSAPIPDTEVEEYKPYVPGQPIATTTGATEDAPRGEFRGRRRGRGFGRDRGFGRSRGFGRGRGRGFGGYDRPEGRDFEGYDRPERSERSERRGYGGFERTEGGRGRGFGRGFGRGSERGLGRGRGFGRARRSREEY